MVILIIYVTRYYDYPVYTLRKWMTRRAEKGERKREKERDYYTIPFVERPLSDVLENRII